MSQYTEEMEGPGWVGLAEVNAHVKQVEGNELETRVINNGNVLQIRGRCTVEKLQKVGAGVLFAKIAVGHRPKRSKVFAATVNSASQPWELKVNGELVCLAEIKEEEEAKISVLLPLT